MSHQQQQVNAQAALNSKKIPTVHVIVDLCKANATFSVKIDMKMTTEHLRDHSFQLFQNFCADNGIKFTPPSVIARDYVLVPSFEDGQIDTAFEPLQLSREGGAPVREQILYLPHPCYVSMVIGEQWLQRDAVQQEETGRRELITSLRMEAMDSLEYFCDISKERAIELKAHRERQMASVAKMDDVLCYLFVAHNRHKKKVSHEQELLQKGEKLWDMQHAQYQQDLQAYTRKKKMFYESSRANVVTTTAALHADHGQVDAQKEQILELLQKFSDVQQ